MIFILGIIFYCPFKLKNVNSPFRGLVGAIWAFNFCNDFFLTTKKLKLYSLWFKKGMKILLTQVYFKIYYAKGWNKKKTLNKN